MKKILPVLLCYVLCASQTYAVSGGPVFGAGGVVVTGSYSGVLEGVTETDDQAGGGPAIPGDPLAPENNTVPSNALGLFNLSVPATGTASGVFILFQDGVVFNGTIEASVDPDNGKLQGILEAQYNFNLETGTATTPVTAQANGQINAKITSGGSAAESLGRLNGTANLEVSFGAVDTTTLQPIIDKSSTFNVIGFKQSATATAVASIGTATGPGSGANGD